MSKDSQDLAEDRTDWAGDRTKLAAERTFAGWMRTGMASVALALGLKAVFGAFEPTWVAKLVATIFIIAAIAIFWSARQKACEAQKRWEENEARTQPTSRVTMLTVIMTVGALATGAILWAL